MTQGNKVQLDNETRSKVRASVSFPLDLHAELERIARDKRVSLAWVIRDAAEQYVAHQGLPLGSKKA